MPLSPMPDLTPEERAVWQRVHELWALALARDAGKIRDTLHPRYVGWDMNSPMPHDREQAIQSVVGEAARVTDYELRPLSIRVYDHAVGVVHYAYRAEVAPNNAAPFQVTGQWSEVYLKQGAAWVMISVSGKPDLPATPALSADPGGPAAEIPRAR